MGTTQTLPLEIFRITTSAVLRPYIYSLGILTTLFSFLLILLFLGVSRIQAGRGTAEIEEDDADMVQMSSPRHAVGQSRRGRVRVRCTRPPPRFRSRVG